LIKERKKSLYDFILSVIVLIKESKIESRISEALKYTDEHITSRVTINSLANFTCLSLYHFITHFYSIHGICSFDNQNRIFFHP